MYGIKEELIKLGMNEKHEGFLYSCYAIKIIDDKGYYIKIEDVYAQIAFHLKKKASNIERCIRYAVEKTWEKGNVERINLVFGYTVDRERGKPTNREFLFMLAEKTMNNDR